MDLRLPITTLKGVGTARAKSFAKLDITTIEDLLYHFPRGYIDFSNLQTIAAAHAQIGETIAIKAYTCAPFQKYVSKNKIAIYRTRVRDNTAYLNLVFFNNRFIEKIIKQDAWYIFYGKVTRNGAILEMNSPECILLHDENESLPMRPVYPLTAGITQKMMRQSMAQAFRYLPIEDALPHTVREKYNLEEINSALRKIHAPQNEAEKESAAQRLAFEEIFTFMLGMQILKRRKRHKNSFIITPDDAFLKLHDYAPTGAQRKAIDEIRKDLVGARSMNRLLQGDVGSGKTLVAGCALWDTVYSGYQAALMAPTEILARQHFEYLAPLFEALGKKTALLVGATKAKEKEEIKKKLQSGEIDLVVGTHALVQQTTLFKNLALVIADEQHRFGVAQRAALGEKGNAPHILVMSATPIPRTMSLMLYGDLDLSVLDELPKGRQKVKTYFVDTEYDKRITAFIQKQILAGGQVYYVCPLVEEGEESDLTSVEEQTRTLCASLPKTDVRMIHGKMPSAEKQRIMQAFVEGQCKVLVSTTVIEVGINVPTATLMVIRNAERFGLSQLHQLRGRVGRGQKEAFCVLISDAKGQKATDRMSFFTSTVDGFAIAEEDLRQRGPGDYFGTRQHGAAPFTFASEHLQMQTFSDAYHCAAEIITKDPRLSDPSHRILRERTARFFEECGEIFN